MVRIEELPQAHQLVLGILADAKGPLSWNDLAARAAAVGISEDELVAVMGVDPRSARRSRRLRGGHGQ